MTEIEFIPLSGGAHLGANAFLVRICFPGEGLPTDENEQTSAVEILLDAGATSAEEPAWMDSLQRPDMVWISHAHWDHVGALPHLAKRFGQLSTLASAPGVELAPLAMTMASGARDKTAAARSQAIASGMRGLQFRTYYAWNELVRGASAAPVRLMAFEAGHLLGAAMLLIEIDRAGQPPYRILYSGDFCAHDQAWLAGAAIPRPSADFQIDTWICEGVLATDVASDQVDYAAELESMAKKCRAHVGPRLVAVAALGEASEMVVALSQAAENRQDAEDFLIVHEYLKPILTKYAEHGAPLQNIRYADSRVCRQMLKAGALVVAGGDKLQVGTAACELALEILEDARAQITVLNRAYAQTPAGKILGAACGETVNIAGRAWKVLAERNHFHLPSHAPRWQLIETARALDARQVVLVHGRERQLYSLRRAMLSTLENVEILIPKNGEAIKLLAIS